MSANSSNVAFRLLLISGGPERIETSGAMPELAAAIANSEDSPLRDLRLDRADPAR